MAATREFSVRDLPKLDLDPYIQNYTGHTRFERLLHIGTHCGPLSTEALKAAVAEAKAGSNVHDYVAAWDAIRKLAPDEPESLRDESWITATNQANTAESTRLERELKVYKNNLIKESIRMGNEDLGRHYQKIGSLGEATEAYNRMRADATANKHMVDCAMRLVEVSLQRHDWNSAIGQVNKIRNVTVAGSEDESTTFNFHRVVCGVAYLCREDFEQAARAFLQCEAAPPASSYSHVASMNDIAVYGGLLSLATMDRKNLQSKVLENQSFRTFLETEPHIRKAIGSFVSGRYTTCLSLLESFRADYTLDIYLSNHVEDLYARIRTKCIVHHFAPFSCVTLESLTAAFGRPGVSMEAEVVEMIRSGALRARVDAKNKLLVAVRLDPRRTMQRNALEIAHKYEAEAKARLRRTNIISAGLEVPSAKKNQDGWQEEAPASLA